MLSTVFGILFSLTGLFQSPTFASITASTTIPNQTPLKEVALTFDDGPYGTSTEEVLNILREKNIHATFFLIGKNVEKYPEQAKEIVAEGNVVGNHTYSHFKNFNKMSTNNFAKDLIKGELEIASSTGVIPKLFRAPYGNVSEIMKKELTKEGYILVSWSVDGKDWSLNKTTDQIENFMTYKTRPYSILLMHDGHETGNYSRVNSIDALPTIIDNLKKEGYTFVTADKLLEVKAY
ncbi:MAG: polysaccharide deacetylase family protein [bacterium]